MNAKTFYSTNCAPAASSIVKCACVLREMASENWKDVLKAQHDDLARLEALDAALNENQISDDIDKLLKRPVRTEIRHTPKATESSAPQPPARRNGASAPPPALDDSIAEDVELPPSSPAGSTTDAYARSEDALLAKNAPETADRFYVFELP